jgi:hypothetical protein
MAARRKNTVTKLAGPFKNPVTISRSAETFILHFMRSGNVAAAAEDAGISRRSGFYMMARPDVRGLILQEAQDRVEKRLLPLTHYALERLLSDRTAPGSAVVAASRLVWEAAGALAKAQLEAGGAGKAAHELDLGQLSARIEALAKAAAERATADARRADAVDVPAESDPFS